MGAAEGALGITPAGYNQKSQSGNNSNWFGDLAKGLLGTVGGDLLGGITNKVVGSALNPIMSLISGSNNTFDSMLNTMIERQPDMLYNAAGQVGRQSQHGAQTALGQNLVEAPALAAYQKENAMGDKLISNSFNSALTNQRQQQNQTSRIASMLRGVNAPVSALGGILGDLTGNISQGNTQLSAQNAQNANQAYGLAGQLSGNAAQGLEQAKQGAFGRRVQPYLTQMNPAAGAMFGTAGQYATSALGASAQLQKETLPTTSGLLSYIGTRFGANVPDQTFGDRLTKRNNINKSQYSLYDAAGLEH